MKTYCIFRHECEQNDGRTTIYHSRSYLIMEKVMSISNLNDKEALHAVSHLRSHFKHLPGAEEELKEVVFWVGGRLSYLNQVSFGSLPNS